ncbi:hypothetical protein MMC10_010836 [Thelotrema lepadinum]|nr:hypothetical protein [Thelotrema lepadinum]
MADLTIPLYTTATPAPLYSTIILAIDRVEQAANRPLASESVLGEVLAAEAVMAIPAQAVELDMEIGGQYSDAVLSELESQNDEQVEGMSARVKMLKDITVAIGDEIRDSTSLAEKMNDSFDNTRVRLRGTMNRMLRMAERTGVGWRVWVGFFAAVIVLFWYVWLF